MVTDAGVVRLVESPLWRRLRWLDLSHNVLTTTGAEALADAPDNAIEHLEVRGMEFGPAARTKLTRMFGHRVHF